LGLAFICVLAAHGRYPGRRRDDPAPSHRGDALTAQPFPTGILRGEPKFSGEFSDRAPALQGSRLGADDPEFDGGPSRAAFLVDFLAERTGFGQHAFEMFKRLFSRFLSRVPLVLFGRRQLAFKWNGDELNSCRDSPARFLVGIEEFLRQRGIPLVPTLLCYRADPLVYILRPDIKALILKP
jgi:hypothetical protein